MDNNTKLDANTNLSSEEQLNLVYSLVYPESLENSKIIGFLNEDFSFNLDEFYNLKEVKKAFETKENLLKVDKFLIQSIEKISFLKVDSEIKNCTISINDDMTIYSLINVPAKLTKDDLVSQLGLQGKEGWFSRFYKKYFVWLLITENSSESQKIEENLKKVYFGDEKLKYDITLSKNLKKLILKRIHYNKESCELKANTKVDHGLGVTHPEAGSWRKKSNDGEEMGVKKHAKNDFPSNTGNFKRKRFNSDGGVDENLVKNEAIFKNEKIVPSSQIKFRYTVKEMLDLFNLSKQSFYNLPKYANFIDEVCSLEMKKSVHVFDEIYNSKRDRSKTMHYQANEFSAFNQKHINLPKNNPLQDINNFDFNCNNNTQHSNQHKNHGKNNHHNHNQNTYKNKFDFAN